MTSRNKITSAILAVCTMAAMASSISASANDKMFTKDFSHWFGSGYTRYTDVMDYHVVGWEDGSIIVTATANTSYSPSELEGDYIKFGTIKYSENETELVFDADSFTNGSFYTVDKTPAIAPDGTHYTEIWCKHASWGLAAGPVFDLTLKPVHEDVNAKVEIFDQTFSMIDLTGGGHMGMNRYASDSFTEWNETTQPISTSAVIDVAPDLRQIDPSLFNIAPTAADIVPAETTATVAATTTAVTTTTTTAAATEMTVPPMPTEPPVETKERTDSLPEEDTFTAEETIVTNVTTSVTTSTTAAETTTTATETEPINEEQKYNKLDINKDGQINWDDVGTLLSYLLSR